MLTGERLSPEFKEGLKSVEGLLVRDFEENRLTRANNFRERNRIPPLTREGLKDVDDAGLDLTQEV